MRAEIYSISSYCNPITSKTKVKGVQYACGCKNMSLTRGFFGGIKAIELQCFPQSCLEHGQEIDILFGRKG